MAEETQRADAGGGKARQGREAGRVQEEGTVGGICGGWACAERKGGGPTAQSRDDPGYWLNPCFLLLVPLPPRCPHNLSPLLAPAIPA